ncbi:RNA polymerase II-specific transcription factor-like protein [Microdochium nivale]|nr:RNA polymerase II-specific transcription factor-like protein [Microdochium nivale]
MRTVSEEPNDRTSQTAKRLACERCRSQKLRCIRRGLDSACARCTQAQAACVVRRRKAPGRLAGYKDNANTPQQTAVESPGMVLAVQDDGFHSSSDLSFFGGSPLGLILDPASMANSDQINDFSVIGLPSDYTTTSALIDSIFADSSVTTSSSPSWPSITTTLAKSQLSPARPSPSERRTSSSCEPGLQLSKLHQNLTSHLAHLRSTPWDILATLRLECSPCLSCHQPTTDSFLESAFDPLASTFRLMSEFEHHITTDSAADAATGHYGPQMRLSNALTAVSCYI